MISSSEGVVILSLSRLNVLMNRFRTRLYSSDESFKPCIWRFSSATSASSLEISASFDVVRKAVSNPDQANVYENPDTSIFPVDTGEKNKLQKR
jgi:hypothetical protein